MSSGKYTNKSTFGGTSTVPAVSADGEVLDMLFLPAGEEVTVYGGQAMIDIVSDTSNAIIEFVEVTDTDAIWASVDVESGASSNTAPEMVPDNTQTGGTTYPFDIPSSDTDRIFAIKLDQAAGAGRYSASMHHSNIKKS